LLELYAKLAEGEKQLAEVNYMPWETVKARLKAKYVEDITISDKK